MVWGAVLVVAWLHICAAHTGPGGPACLPDLVWHNGQCFGRLDIGRVVRGSGRCGGQRDYPGLLSDYDMPDIQAVGGRLLDRKRVVWGRRVSVGVDMGGARIINKKKSNI